MDRLSLPRLFLPLLACLCCAAFPAAPAQAQSAPVKSAGALADFGDPNLAALAARVRKGGSRLVLTQLGDSHTAADFFTGQLRSELQADHGDGGIGWLPPMAIPGVLHSRVLLGTQGWKAFDSRTERDVDFPLGGYIARPDGPWTGTLITPIDPAKDATGAWRLSLWLRGAPNAAAMTWRDGAEKISPVPAPPRDGRWHRVTLPVTLPLTLLANDRYSYDVGGMVLERGAGAQVDALGSNGTRIGITGTWGADWLQMLAQRAPDIVVLAYGTNEASDWTLDPAQYAAALRDAIAGIRRALPKAVVLMLGPPDQIGHAGQLDARCTPAAPAGLHRIRDAQLQVARDTHALFWDWQQAMGGPCSMAKWQASQDGAADGIHFTPTGYQRAARLLRKDLKALSGI